MCKRKGNFRFDFIVFKTEAILRTHLYLYESILFKELKRQLVLKGHKKKSSSLSSTFFFSYFPKLATSFVFVFNSVF